MNKEINTPGVQLEFWNDANFVFYKKKQLIYSKMWKNTSSVSRFCNVNFSECRCSRFNCEVNFLSTLSTFSHQSDLQSFSSPLHLSVLQHLSVDLSHLFYIAVYHSVTVYTASKLNHRHNKRTWYGWCKAVTQTYVRHRNSGCCIYMIADIWNQKYLSLTSSNLPFVLFKQGSSV